jgi:hypothetical protein
MTEGPGQEEPASSPDSDAPLAEGHQQEAMTTRERALVRGTYIFLMIVLVGVVVWGPVVHTWQARVGIGVSLALSIVVFAAMWRSTKQ